MTDLAGALRSEGRRLTPQRMMVFETLARGGHLSAEEIQRQVAAKYPGINLSTVYRILDLLVARGLARKASIGSDRARFEAAASGEPHHHHLVCRTCGGVEHLAGFHLDPVEAHLAEEHGFAVEESMLTSFGTCRRCLEAQA